MICGAGVDPGIRLGKPLRVVAAAILMLASILAGPAPAAESRLARFDLNAVSPRHPCLLDAQESAPNECLGAVAPLAACIPASVELTQACDQPRCPAGQVPCNVTVGAGGQLCWFCCPG